jgi:sigma-B regulation protein RsbU (phosphoserine phosphatase)
MTAPSSEHDRYGPEEALAALRLQLRQIAELQRRLLPQRLPQPPNWRVAAGAWVSPRPGGDYFDALPLPDGRLALVIADASGHGGPAAVMVAQARTLLHACPVSSGRSRQPFCPLGAAAVQPAHLVLDHLGRILAENSLEDFFMTAWYALLTPTTGELEYAAAGHPPPRWWHAVSDHLDTPPDVAGPPLAVAPALSYGSGRIVLQRGDVLVWYTDGLTDACDRRGEPFGIARLDAAIRETAAQGADAVKRHVLEQLEKFLSGAEPADDVTLLVLGREP